MNDKLPSAHAETISIDTAYPLYYGNPNSASDTLQGEIVTNDNTSIGMRFIPVSNVIAVTKKGPSLYQPFGFTNTDIDIDILRCIYIYIFRVCVSKYMYVYI